MAAGFRFSCPHCDKVLKTSTPPAPGKRIRCPGCGEVFAPELDDSEDEATAFQERPAVKGKATVRPRDEEEDESPRTRKKEAAGVNMMVYVALGLLGVGGLLSCGCLGVTAFAWPGFMLDKKANAKLPDLAVNAENKKAPGDDPAKPGIKGDPNKFNYYPLDVGNAWHFRLNINGNNVPSSVRISKHENINGVLLARLDSLNGPITEHLTQTDKGIFRHRINGAAVTPAFQLMPYPPVVGAKWSNEFTTDLEPGRHRYTGEIQQEEVVTVPAGKFKTLRVHLRINQLGNPVDTTYWFANGIGFVKQQVSVGGLDMMMELDRFEGKNGKFGP